MFNLAKYFTSGVKSGIEKAADNGTWQTVKNIGAATASLVSKVFKGVKIWKDLAENIDDISYLFLEETFNEDYLLLVRLVYNLYYRMVGNTTTNYYTLPCSDATIFDTKGSDGWNVGGNTLDNAGFMGGAQSMIGKLAAFGLSNLKIQTTPMWKGNSGAPHGGVSVKFSLFNSSVESAVNNFRFINTIFPNNMFTQYGIFQ